MSVYDEAQQMLSLLMKTVKERNDALAENTELRDCLRWYVENDDTNNTEYNKSWLDGKRRAMVALGMEVD